MAPLMVSLLTFAMAKQKKQLVGWLNIPIYIYRERERATCEMTKIQIQSSSPDKKNRHLEVSVT